MELNRLAPREREIAEIVHRLGEVSAADVERILTDPLSNSAVRSMLRRLEAKGVVRRRRLGKKFLYVPAAANRAAREAALKRVSREYFGGSLAEAAAALSELARTERIARAPTASAPLSQARRSRPDEARLGSA